MPEEMRSNAMAAMLAEMESLALRIRELIAIQPPRDLLGYVYGQRILKAISESESRTTSNPEPAEAPATFNDDIQLLLEYIHAVLASTKAKDDVSFDETASIELVACAGRLKEIALLYAVASSVDTKDGAFGPDTGTIEFHAKSTWVLLRGNRYQVLEGEFYAFMLAPHDTLLREIYGIGSSEIACGFQDIANAVRTGYADAVQETAQQIAAAQTFATTQGRPFEEIAADWVKNHAAEMKATALAFDDMVRGGICNVSRHTALPPELLADLSYERGEEMEFFSEGPYSGTPFRTLPVRKKPLIKLDDEYYATDPCFVRDAGYRALLWNLLRRKPEYKKRFEQAQKTISEEAFFTIFSDQLKNATVHKEVYYKDPTTKQWVENDTLILIDDVLILVEAKSGAAATIASPVSDFWRHAQSIRDLFVHAFEQCQRFFEYVASADEVPIFARRAGKYLECGRLQRSHYRLMIPVGLTMESFSPFSTMGKDLPDIVPLLGKHPFLSLSIDDLFVLKRFLPTMGELAHYLDIRQAVAGMRGAHLFDEFDHLGAYITKNRFDEDIRQQRANEGASLLIWDGMSEIVDRHFSGEDWEAKPVPVQSFPSELFALLRALDKTRAPGWLSAESGIRNYGEEGRQNLSKVLAKCRVTLREHPSRYFSVSGDPSIFIWLQRPDTLHDPVIVTNKACAAALATNTSSMLVLLVTVEAAGGYIAAERLSIDIPTERTAANSAIYEEAERMIRQGDIVEAKEIVRTPPPSRRPGRNEPCWCGSEIKFKKCHGR